MKIELNTDERERLLSGLQQEADWWKNQIRKSSQNDSAFSKKRVATAKRELEKTDALAHKLQD